LVMREGSTRCVTSPGGVEKANLTQDMKENQEEEEHNRLKRFPLSGISEYYGVGGTGEKTCQKNPVSSKEEDSGGQTVL